MSDDLDFMPVSPAPKPGADTPKPEPARPAAAPAKPAEPERTDLPTWNRSRRKRTTKADSAQPEDAFQRGVRTAGRQAIDFPKLVIGTIVIGIAAIAAAVLLSQRSAGANAEASRVLGKTTTTIVRGQILPAEEQARLTAEIARAGFPVHATEEERELAISAEVEAALAVDRPDVATDARLVAAAHEVRLGNFAAGLEHYDQFLAEADADHPLRFMALEGKGIALEAEEDFEGALAVFQQLAPRPTDFYRSAALAHQGRVLEELGRPDEALAIYEQFFTEFPPAKLRLGSNQVRERAEALDPTFGERFAAPSSGLDLGLPPGLTPEMMPSE